MSLCAYWWLGVGIGAAIFYLLAVVSWIWEKWEDN